MTGPQATRTRRHDPLRRRRLAEAAASILRQKGVFSLTHRAVAAEADVPLGSTTYHFRDLDALLEAALEVISVDEVALLDRWEASWDLAEDLEDALVALVLSYTNDHREQTILEYEIHMLAYRRPSMRQLGERWQSRFSDIVSPHLPPEKVPVVIAAFDGIMLHGLSLDGLLSDEWARDFLCKLVF